MSGYIGPIPVPQGIQNKETFTATAGQTTFNTNGYTDGAFISVYLNGVRLINGTDYTATNGSDIVLTQAASVSDVLDFETFNSFSLASQQFENITTKNPTHEDTDGGRESALSFQGEQSGGEISTLAAIQASHDGTADDQKGDLIFKTNDGSDGTSPTEAMRIQSDQKIGIAVNDPDAVLDISGGSNKLGILRVVQRASGAAAYGLDVGLDPTLGDPVFSKIENDVVAESFRIRRTNGALISSGGITLGTTSGAYAAANTLDDYEEGTFTATLVGYYASPSSAVTATGLYTKVGNKVELMLNFENVNTTGASGNMWVTGLPFASSGVYCILPAQMNSAGTFPNSSPFGLVSGTVCYFYKHASNAGASAVFHNAGTSRTIRVSGNYRVA